ncbi:MAG: ABC transporter ATP-binding protein [Oscillospiraceae bacterium]|nr:ABC transporter ATP-binding protein [Oscillospiraceae bacterium]
MKSNKKPDKNTDDILKHPDRLFSYFKKEYMPLLAVTVSGIIYNIGLAAGPYLEGKLAQRLYDIIEKRAVFSQMVSLALIYILVILIVQGARCIKRFYVRRFANNTSLTMRRMLYNNLVHKSKNELESESTGSLMTKAIADVDACAEGMRKFTTEVFDTGIALGAYFVMMLRFDWQLALLSCMFIPAAYIIAGRMKTLVCRYNNDYKKCCGELTDVTMERVSGALTYRISGQEADRNSDYEEHLKKYEKTAVMANIWENTLTPVYNIISMTGVVFILYFGGKNVLSTGHRVWDIAAFTAFLSCFAKMALKSSKAAKLFNSVQKASVSFKRIRPLMKAYENSDTHLPNESVSCTELEVRDLAFKYDNDNYIFSGLSFTAHPGDIIGVAGPVACGKSTFGRTFLCEMPYEGSIKIDSRELSDLSDYQRNSTVSYLGHQPELMSDTIEENICADGRKSADKYLKAVCLDKDIAGMPDGIQTETGYGGLRLSGGQQDRLALARTLYSKRKIMILDDPFSAVDIKTQEEIMSNIREMLADCIVIIISHRVSLFSSFDKVIWMEDGKAFTGTHSEILSCQEHYAQIFMAQKAGGEDEKQ